jgi:hypothetical protein
MRIAFMCSQLCSYIKDVCVFLRHTVEGYHCEDPDKVQYI